MSSGHKVAVDLEASRRPHPSRGTCGVVRHASGARSGFSALNTTDASLLVAALVGSTEHVQPGPPDANGHGLEC